MSNTIFELKDGRTITIDFTNIDDLTKVERSDWVEISQQLKEWFIVAKESLAKDMEKYGDLTYKDYIFITNSTYEELKNCNFEKIRMDGRDCQCRELRGFRYASLHPKITSDRLEPTYFISYKNLELYEISNKQFNELTRFFNKQMSEKSKILIKNDWPEINEILKNEGK